MKRKAKRKAQPTGEQLGLRMMLDAGRQIAQRDAMLDALCKALERANVLYTFRNYVARQRFLENMAERKAFADFFHDVQLLRSQGAHALCGATWIRADALEGVCKKYAEATEKIR